MDLQNPFLLYGGLRLPAMTKLIAKPLDAYSMGYIERAQMMVEANPNLTVMFFIGMVN